MYSLDKRKSKSCNNTFFNIIIYVVSLNIYLNLLIFSYNIFKEILIKNYFAIYYGGVVYYFSE